MSVRSYFSAGKAQEPSPEYLHTLGIQEPKTSFSVESTVRVQPYKLRRGEYFSKKLYFCTEPKIDSAQESGNVCLPGT